jgi:hypothetical protein
MIFIRLLNEEGNHDINKNNGDQMLTSIMKIGRFFSLSTIFGVFMLALYTKNNKNEMICLLRGNIDMNIYLEKNSK